jgi:DNA-binding MarR family transcriptional regulator
VWGYDGPVASRDEEHGTTDPVEERERERVTATEASWALRDVNRAADEVDHALARRLGLRALDYTAVNHVLGADQPMGPFELGRRLGISSGSATELVDRLERAGHLERRRDRHDRRRVALHPSEETLARVIEELSPLFAAVDHAAGDYTEAELAAVVRYLRTAAEIMRGFARPAPT